MAKLPPDNLSKKAEAATQAKDWPMATKLWREIIENYKAAERPYGRLAEAYRQTKHYEAAADVIRRGQKEHKHYMPLFTEAGMLATVQGDWPAAAEAWQKVIEKFKDQAPPTAWARLSQAYRAEKMFKEAETTVRQSLKKFPNHGNILEEAAEVASAAQDWSAAISRWQAVVDYSPEPTAEAWRRLAFAQRQSGDSASAQQTIKAAKVAYPDNLELDWELAEILTATENYSGALRVWQAVLPELPTEHVGQRLYVRFQISLVKRLGNLPGYKQIIHGYNIVRRKRPPRIAIVTSVTKGFDLIKPHEVLDGRFDYLMYTDADFDDLGFYQIKPIPVQGLDGARASRYMKTHAHELAGQYDTVIWMDASLMIVGDLYPIIEDFIASGKPIGANVHRSRRTIQEEYEACLALHKDDPAVMKKQIDAYAAEGFNGSGLAECTFLAFNLRDCADQVKAAMELWWLQILGHSRRDQLSFPYALWKTGAQWHPLTKPPHGVINNQAFVLTAHQTEYPALTELVKLLRG